MIRFADKDLFGSGPSRAELGGLSLRHALHQGIGGQGVQLSAQGRSGRAIAQSGELYADKPAGLTTQTSAIEAMLDGRAYRWSDGLGHELEGVVMLSFEAGPMRRVGTRWSVSYKVNYLQLMTG